MTTNSTASTQTPAPKKHGWLYVAAGVLILAIGIGTAIGGQRGDPASTAAPSPPTVAADTPGQAFVKDFKSYPGLTTDMSDADLIRIAAGACDLIGTPGITYDNLVAALGTTKFGPQVAPVLVNAANRSYCPGKLYTATTAVATASTYQETTPQASGPLTSFSDGIYEVGNAPGQIAPGKYKSSNPDGDGAIFAKKADGSYGDYASSKGQLIVTIKKSDAQVEVIRATFTKA